MLCHRSRGSDVVHHDRQLDTLPTQRSHTIELAGRNADSVQNVPHATGGELFRFLQCRYRRRPVRTVHHATSHFDRFRRLQVRAQIDAEFVETAS
jgi:hypothetical protein